MRKFTRSFAAAALFASSLAAVATLTPASAVGAQDSEKLVSNNADGSKDRSTLVLTTTDAAQGFTTGANRGGWTLTSVDLALLPAVTSSGETESAFTVSIHPASASDSSVPAATSVGTLSGPASLETGHNTFSAAGDGIYLDEEQTYFVVVDVTTTGDTELVHKVLLDAEDQGATGWTISDSSVRRASTTWAKVINGSHTPVLMVAVHGRANAEPAGTALASNLDETSDGEQSMLWDRAQSFSTGPDTRGYKLTSVSLNLNISGNQSTVAVAVYGATSGVKPDTSNKLGDLTNPGNANTVGAGTRTFTAPGAGIDLLPSTTYFVVADGNNHGKWKTSETSDDQDLGAEGWGIGDVAYFLSGSSWTLDTSDGTNTPVLLMAVNGYSKGAVPPGAPTVGVINGGNAASAAGSLIVNWSAPTETGGSGVIDYDLRYFAGTSDPDDEADWVTDGEAGGLPDLVTTTSAKITGLKAAASYRVQVRAANAAGEGPWSASGGGSTIASTKSGNTAPVVFKQQVADPNDGNNTCAVDTAATPARPTAKFNSAAGTLVGATLARPPAAASVPPECKNGIDDPILHDADGDALEISVAATLPANVRSLHEPGEAPYPTAGHYPDQQTRHRLFNKAVAAGTQTDVTATVTAVDPHGASRTFTFTFAVGTFANAVGKPSFDESVGLVRAVKDQEIDPLVLPAASGGDTKGGTIPYYLYEVSGLPPGLSFDRETRTLSGTPTTAGTWTVSYVADDYDGFYSQATGTLDGNTRPTASDLADAATQTFTIRVAAAATAGGIEMVRLVSLPTLDGDNNGVIDTYVHGSRILVDVEMSEPVKVTGDFDNVRLRLDLGTDDTDLSNSRKVMKLDSIRNGGRTLRFAYTVLSSDTDTDGVWVQTDAQNRVVFLANTPAPTITSAATGLEMSLTLAGLPTTGRSKSKVDGSSTNSSTGPVPESAEINGATLTVTFSADLDSTAVKTADLALALSVQGAADISGGNRNAYQHPEWISISGKVLTLTLIEPARAGQTVTLSYAGGGNLQNTSNKAAPPFSRLDVVNNTPAERVNGPELLRASAAGSTVTLLFDSDLDESSRPPGSAFVVGTGDNNLNHRVIRGTGTVAVKANTATVTLAESIGTDETASITYTRPATKMLRRALTHTQVPSFVSFRVESVDDIGGPESVGSAFFYIGGSNPPVQTDIFLYFDEALDESSVPAAADFAVTIDGTSATQTPSAVEVANNAVVLTVGVEPAVSSKSNSVTYTPGTNPIRDLAGNPAATFTQSGAQAAPGKPGLQPTKPIVVDGALLQLRFNSKIDPRTMPAASAFSPNYPLRAGQTDADRISYPVEIVALSATGRVLDLHLANPVHPCAGATPLTISYTKPSSSAFKGVSGAEADSISHTNVTNTRHSKCVRTSASGAGGTSGAQGFGGVQPKSATFDLGRSLDRSKKLDPADFTVNTPAAGASGASGTSGTSGRSGTSGASGASAASALTVQGASFAASGSGVTLTLSRSLAAGETATVGYVWPRSGEGLWDTDGNQIDSFDDVDIAGPEPLTAEFAGLPAAHDGSRLFSFKIQFSEEFRGLRLSALRNGALDVVGGRIIDTRRTVRGQNRSITVRVRPTSTGDMTLTLAAPTHCAAADAICTHDGDKLAASVSATVPGPDPAPAQPQPQPQPQPVVLPVLSVADAQADEGGTVEFAVTLSAPAPGAVTVDYATADSTATAGADYSAASGTLSFTAGETAKTIAVTALTDSAAEPDETFTLTLSNASGATIADSTATGTVADVAPPPLTAAFAGLPALHNGSRLFGFEIRFSEEFDGLRLTALRDGALEVTGGRIIDVKRTVRGANQSITVRVRPTSADDVALTLAATADCTAADAICTDDGRTLAETITATVPGPQRLGH